MNTVSLAPHEFDANLLFNSHGLAPHFALDSAVKDADGSETVEFTSENEQWKARLSYQDSNIVHPGATTPGGTEYRLESVKEYRIKIFRHPGEDEIGQQDFTAHIAPRWPSMRGERDDGSKVEIPVPDGFGEGVNVRIQGSNIGFERYPELLRIAAATLGIAGRYFADIHHMSNIQDAERYVRVHDDESGPVHSRDGPIASLGHLLEDDRSGYRKVVQNDNDELGRNVEGYYHTTTLGPRRVQEAFPDHELPKEVKHYYARESVDFPDDHPLSHPKVGASLQVSRLGRNETVRYRNVEQLRRELDQTVLSVLADAGLDIAPSRGFGPFFADDYWDFEVSESGPDPIGLDLTRIRQSQESVVIQQVADGLSPVQWDSLETLVTDGGEVAPADIADEQGRHVESVRRALREMDDLVHREYAEVSLRSDHVAELVHDAVSEARESVQRAAETTAKALNAAEQGMGETMSSFIAWAARHGVDVDETRDARLRLRAGDFKGGDLQAAIKEGFRVWTAAGMSEQAYRQGEIHHGDGSISDVWRWLK